MMKKTIKHWLSCAGTALFLFAMTVFPAFAAPYGQIEMISDTTISGWVWNPDKPGQPVTVELVISDGSPESSAFGTVTIPANQPRAELKQALGSENHGFSHTIDWSLFKGSKCTISAFAVDGNTKTPLGGSGISYYRKDAASEQDLVPAQGGPGQTAAVPNGSAADLTSDSLMAYMSLGPGYFANAALTAASLAPTNQQAPDSEQAAPQVGERLGTFTISGYCPCTKCCKDNTLTYSGTVPQAKHTLSADLSRFPIGTKLYIDGVVYTVEDMGSSVLGDKLDIFFATHEEALAFGLQTMDVYAVVQ